MYRRLLGIFRRCRYHAHGDLSFTLRQVPELQALQSAGKGHQTASKTL
jgi:ABC-type antimicrobial peptide transport system ATPase subunit